MSSDRADFLCYEPWGLSIAPISMGPETLWREAVSRSRINWWDLHCVSISHNHNMIMCI